MIMSSYFQYNIYIEYSILFRIVKYVQGLYNSLQVPQRYRNEDPRLVEFLLARFFKKLTVLIID